MFPAIMVSFADSPMPITYEHTISGLLQKRSELNLAKDRVDRTLRRTRQASGVSLWSRVSAAVALSQS
jgi:hypothetical protein